MHRPTSDAGQPVDRDVLTAHLLACGDPDGLRRLLNDHGGRVMGLLRRDFGQALDMHDIEDALSEASVRVWRAGGSYDAERGALGSWLYVIARNCARRVLETKRRHAGLALVDNLDSLMAATGLPLEEPLPGERPPLPDRRFLRDVQVCIDELPPQQRAVLRADLSAGGLAPTDVLAEQLQTSRNSIYVSRSNGRLALREAMRMLGHALEDRSGTRTRGRA